MQPAKSGWLCWSAVFLETLPCQCSSGWTQHTSASRTFAGCGRFSALSPLLQRKWLLVVQPCVSPSHPSDFICVQWHVSFLLELALTFAAIAPSCSGLQKTGEMLLTAKAYNGRCITEWLAFELLEASRDQPLADHRIPAMCICVFPGRF